MTDEPWADRDDWLARVAAAARGGATMVQVRAKQTPSRELLDVVRRLVAAVTVPVVVNDRADVAIMAGAAGVHLGPDDLPVAAVRAIAPRAFIIGASLGSGDELASARGADYVGIGPAFATPSKTDAGTPLSFEEIGRLQEFAAVPAVAIGGITAANVRGLLAACPGLRGVAALSSLFGAGDVESAAAALRAAIGR